MFPFILAACGLCDLLSASLHCCSKKKFLFTDLLGITSPGFLNLFNLDELVQIAFPYFLSSSNTSVSLFLVEMKPGFHAAALSFVCNCAPTCFVLHFLFCLSNIPHRHLCRFRGKRWLLSWPRPKLVRLASSDPVDNPKQLLSSSVASFSSCFFLRALVLPFSHLIDKSSYLALG